MTERKDIQLDKSTRGHSSKKFTCPACGHKRFVRYFNFTDAEYLADEFGRCDREEHCGYFEAPYESLKLEYQKNQERVPGFGVLSNRKQIGKPRTFKPSAVSPAPPPKIQAVPKDQVRVTLGFYHVNKLSAFLYGKIGKLLTDRAISRYMVGTGKGGATLFWYIDRFMRVRTAKRMMYGDNTGKRDKAIPPDLTHTAKDGFSLCLFGEHLLYLEPGIKTVAIVESEKTAILCSLYLPTIAGEPVIWLASGSANGLTEDRIKPLQGYNVILCPDFSYHARATWGQLPMRKQKTVHPETGKPRTIPHPDGELQEDYESAAMRIKKIAASVRFFDPCPDCSDSSDIADILLTLPPPQSYIKPDFSKYAGRQNNDNAQTTYTDAPNFDDGMASGTFPLVDTEIAFRIGRNSRGDLIPYVEPIQFAPVVQKWLNYPNLANLIKSLDICEGTLLPYDYEKETVS